MTRINKAISRVQLSIQCSIMPTRLLFSSMRDLYTLVRDLENALWGCSKKKFKDCEKKRMIMVTTETLLF